MSFAKNSAAAMAATLLGLGMVGSAQAVSSTSSPSNWRLLPGQAFKGVAGALDGVARIQFDGYVCSGSLLAGGAYVVTAAHCADGFSSMTVEFGVVGDQAAVTRSVAAKDAHVNPGWNGTLDTGADIAILKLSAPVTGIRGFNLSTTNDVGKDHLLAGYGTTATGGGGISPGWDEWGYAHYGYNTFDVTSKTFNDAWDGSGVNTYGETYVIDFDNGLSRNNTLQRVADLRGNGWASGLGLGADEALIAGGDSGGGDYVWNGSEWLLSGVHSWGWQFCQGRVSPNCDLFSGASSSYGDLSGSTAVFSHGDWISSVISVPEPGTFGLMLAGLAAAGWVARRREARGTQASS